MQVLAPLVERNKIAYFEITPVIMLTQRLYTCVGAVGVIATVTTFNTTDMHLNNSFACERPSHGSKLFAIVGEIPKLMLNNL